MAWTFLVFLILNFCSGCCLRFPYPISIRPKILPAIEKDGSSLFFDNFNGDNSVAGLQSRGYTVLNVDGGGTTDPWFQPTGTQFPAYEGPTTGYVAANYQGANGFLIDQWLISPQITETAGDTLSFCIVL